MTSPDGVEAPESSPVPSDALACVRPFESGPSTRSAERFNLLAETASQLLLAPRPQEIVESLCRRVMQHLDCQFFFNYFVDDKSGGLCLNACGGIPSEVAQSIRWLDRGAAVCGLAALQACRVVAEHIPSTPNPRTDLVRSFGVRAYACHPLLAPEGRVIGTLSFGTAGRETFSDDDLSMMKAVADLVAGAMHRIQSEQEKREQERRLGLALDAAWLAPWDLDSATDLVGATDRLRELLGLPPGTGPMPVTTWHELIVPEDRARVAEAVRRAWTGEEKLAIEYRIQRPDGQVRWIAAEAVLTRDARTGADRMVGVAADVTQRRESEETMRRTADQLARSNEELQQFAYVASHDMQEPLRSINIVLGLLREHFSGELDPKARDYLLRASHATVRMHHLIEALGAYSRVGRETLVDPVDLERVLDRVVDGLRMALDQAEAVVTRDELPTVHGSGVELGLVFQNLIDNAVKFRNERRPEIHVGVTSKGPNWVFSVRDNGPGINPRYAEKIFAIFQRLQGHDVPGAGVGLAICRKIVERHGGSIWMESRPGSGATFFFTLPK